MRLQKYLAHCGIASRRKSEELIVEGRVMVNGQVIKELGTQVDTLNDEVLVDGNSINTEKPIYIMLNKPKGYVTTVKDQYNRPTVIDLVKEFSHIRLYPVGRLDYYTEGLLILTNDGIFTNQLIHPRYKIPKTYIVDIDRNLQENDLTSLREGILLDDGLTLPADVRKLTGRKISLTIYEGRNRQIRRMFDKLLYRINNLKRIKFGNLPLGNLSTGNYRLLTNDEINSIIPKL